METRSKIPCRPQEKNGVLIPDDSWDLRISQALQTSTQMTYFKWVLSEFFFDNIGNRIEYVINEIFGREVAKDFS